MARTNVYDEFLGLLTTHEASGISDQTLREHFAAAYEQLVPIINELLQVNRLQLFYQGNNLIYKLLNENTAAKFEGLGPEQLLVYQVCERSGNKGIWTRDIKSATNIPQHQLAKTLKTLEQRNLIKSVRSITSKSKKLYMLYDATPAKDITGGPWYTDQEFDHAFMEELHSFILRLVETEGLAGLDTICERVRISGISKVELSTEEMQLVLQTLIYDGKLEEVAASVASMAGQASIKTTYKISNQIEPANYLTDTPCGKCPVSDRCCVGGVISPESCSYMRDWLAMPAEQDIEDMY